MNTYSRKMKTYTLEVNEIEGRFYPMIRDARGNTWTGTGYASRESALGSLQRKYATLTK